MYKKSSLFLKLLSILSGMIVAAHLRGMPPAPTTKKGSLMLRKNSNTNTKNQTFNYVLLVFF